MLTVIMLSVVAPFLALFFVSVNKLELYEETTFQYQIKFVTDDYLQIYKTLLLFTNIVTLNTNVFTSIKVIKNTYVQTQSYKNANSIH
jgi:hypothetical protein